MNDNITSILDKFKKLFMVKILMKIEEIFKRFS